MDFIKLDKHFNSLDKVVDESLWHIDAIAEKRGWCAQPELLLVYTERQDMLGVLIIKEFDGWDLIRDYRCEVKECPCGGDHGTEASLVVLAKALEESPDGLVKSAFHPQSLYGVALVDETWMIRQVVDPLAPPVNIAADPDRIEARLVYMMSMTGRASVLVHERDGVARTYETAEEMPSLLPALMTRIVEALLS